MPQPRWKQHQIAFTMADRDRLLIPISLFYSLRDENGFKRSHLRVRRGNMKPRMSVFVKVDVIRTRDSGITVVVEMLVAVFLTYIKPIVSNYHLGRILSEYVQPIFSNLFVHPLLELQKLSIRR